MQTLTTIAEVRAVTGAWRRQGERIALVPTLGNLHRGHRSLMEEAARHAQHVVVSVFVNPTQFGPGEDYARYPRTPEADAALCRDAGVALVFAPGVEELYPGGVAAALRIEVPRLGEILCGASRPGHFSGVATVVAKLFNAVQPDVAVFGEKDFQQLMVIRRLVASLHFPIEIVGAPIVREPDGLALSSRNQYLTAEERSRAPRLFRCLQRAAAALEGGEDDYRALEAQAAAGLEEAGFRLDYVAIRRAVDLDLPAAGERDLAVLAAACLGRARLIDNVRVQRAPRR
jgi:pantoate--beta-alanine ligase